MQERSILAAIRPRVTLALRAAPHLTIGLFSERQRPSMQRIALAAAALLGDAWLYRRLVARPDDAPGPVRVVLDTMGAAVWTLAAGAEAGPANFVQNAYVVAPGLEAGFRLGAGTEAVPIVVPPKVYPPRPKAQAVARSLLPVALPFATHVVIRRRQGRSWNAIPPAFATIGGFALARHRDHLQRDARQRWWERAQVLVAEEAHRTAAGAATRPSPGHDFKKTLAVLAWCGSEAAKAAMDEQMSHPSVATHQAGGATIGMTVPGLPVEPPDAADTWLDPPTQVRLLDYLDSIDDLLEDRAPPPLMQVANDERGGLHIRYRGHLVSFAPTSPQIDAALDPVSAAIGVGITFKVISALEGAHPVPPWVAAPVVLVDLALLEAHRRRRRARREDRFRLAAIGSTVSALGFMAAASATSPRTTARAEEFPVLLGAMAALGVLGTCNEQAGRQLTQTLVGLTSAATIGLWFRNQRLSTAGSAWAVADLWTNAGASLWMTYAASHGLTTRIAAETANVEALLAEEFSARLRSARSAASRRELERFQAQLDIARVELAARRGAMDPDLVAFVEQECTDLHRWLVHQDRRPLPRPSTGADR